MSSALAFDTHGPEETQELGRRLGAAAEVGDLILLEGGLGAGKTTLAQGLAWGAGVTGYAHSPTFVMVHEYAGRITLYHVDLYRLSEGDIEAHDLGIDEMLDHMEAHQPVEARRSKRQGEEVAANEEGGIRLVNLVRRGAIEADDPGAGGGEVAGAVARAGPQV